MIIITGNLDGEGAADGEKDKLQYFTKHNLI